MGLRFSKCETGKGKKSAWLLFIPYINTGNLVLPPNRGRLDELDSSRFILHRNGSLKERAPVCARRRLGRAQNGFTVSLRAGRTNEGGEAAAGAQLSKPSPCPGEMEVSLIMDVSQELPLIF